ncbi:MAG: hypothetical protein ACREK2_09995 [Gemmatimonadota bacterium]
MGTSLFVSNSSFSIQTLEDRSTRSSGELKLYQRAKRKGLRCFLVGRLHFLRNSREKLDRAGPVTLPRHPFDNASANGTIVRPFIDRRQPVDNSRNGPTGSRGSRKTGGLQTTYSLKSDKLMVGRERSLFKAVDQFTNGSPRKPRRREYDLLQGT